MTNQKLINALKITLADSYTLYLKIQNFHWNVTGEQFFNAHSLLEQYYTELFDLNDKLAERLRALETEAPASFKEYLGMTNITEAKGQEINCKEALKTVAEDKKIFLNTVRTTLATAKDANDPVTETMMADIVASLEKQLWMLASMMK